ncbi:multidrug efflux RND transporter permease subunit [Rhodoplanes sp. TEM]|uniref:Efflux pump membrane transporter n=1 Tax=Rhodoplanes tepidamans TaxID=200616 RepID=A0ABT5JAL0_RHOTP|nr:MULTISPECIES: multidrug efflux RND transporter permease subunit [Rhodoplanes]MDC7786627.1 multidrug efflux RND transporter permease subunit [Rhodoplanes tepidamans]MDC7983026.1 multidrug efflux RND transporter permease subunit [Rhodoplanes sp. TEM]MDQ0356408.1 hydrophobe/amphiphile efflux-1 (HAE1) family protein [Rhodoplanes tepidamans]
MKLSHFFIERPIFASVVSIVIVILGAVAYIRLPVAQYPEIAPPVINVTGQYPGASAETVAETVVAPIEQQINGVEGMLYISSNSTADGRFSISVTFNIGVNLDIAQVQVQNRVAVAQPRLPLQVQQIGVTVNKSSPDILMVVNLFSPDSSRDTLFISNFANIQIKDVLSRVDGVGSITVFGSRDYAMQIWLDPDRLQSLNLTAQDVTAALQAQNIQVASGVLNQPPVPEQLAFQVAVRTLGRLSDPVEFANVVVKQTDNAVVRIKDIGRVELTAQDYSSTSYLDRQPSVALGVFQRPGSNALTTGQGVVATMERLASGFPEGVKHAIIYNPTTFIAESVRAVVETIFEAAILVVLVVILFLQTWRAAVIPILAIPISLVGTFFVMSLFGFSLNNLSLFGLVLAIGIVVDDAIVVVENVERNISAGLSPRDAAHKTMDEVGGALVAIALVLSAVFVPTAFITGISGQFYQQFALTIAGSTLISLLVSLTLSPALCALLLKGHDPHHRERWFEKPVHGFFRLFNRGFDAVANGYGWLAGRVVRLTVLMLLAYAAVLGFGLNEFRSAPQGFIPQQDRGYLIVASQLPPGSSLQRTDAVMKRAADMALATPGVGHAINIVGFSGATFTNAPNAGAMFLILEPFEKRVGDPAKTAAAIQGALFGKLAAIQEAFMVVVLPPPVQGIGNAGGYRMMVQDRNGVGSQALLGSVYGMMGRAAQTPGLKQVYSLFETSTPQLYLDIDRTKAQLLGINMADVFNTLQVYIGSLYVNDFNLFGRTFRVQAQADAEHRLEPKDVLTLRVRNSRGETVPIGAFTTVRDISGPYRVPRYNLYPAAELDGDSAPGYSQGQAIAIMEKLAAETLPPGIGYEWTGLAYQQIKAGDTALFAFGLGVVFVFLVLAAQYESLTLPLAVIMIVPMCLVAAITGVILRGMDNNILTQVGFVVLIGLAAKNAILIVEFAKQLEDQGRDRASAAVEAARLRLRPILMTSLAFILGVVPLVWATGAGAELRQALGTAVFSGMIGVTTFGLIFTPAFYVVGSWLSGLTGGRRRAGAMPAAPTGQPAE